MLLAYLREGFSMYLKVLLLSKSLNRFVGQARLLKRLGQALKKSLYQVIGLGLSHIFKIQAKFI